MKLLRQLLILFKPAEKLTLLFFLFLNVSSSLLELAGIGAVIPFILLLINPKATENNRYVKMLYDWIQPESHQSFVTTIAIFFIIFFIMKNIYMMGVYGIQQLFLRHKYVEITDSLITNYLLKPYKYFFDHSGAEILRNVQAIHHVVTGMLTPMLNLLSEFVTISILAIFVLWINPALAVSFGIGAMILVWAGLKFLKKKTHQYGHERMALNKELINNVMQGFGSIKESRILGNEQEILNSNLYVANRMSKLNVFTNMLSVVPRFYIESIAVTAVVLLMLVMLHSGMKEESIIIEISLFSMIAIRLMPSITRISMAVSNIRTYIPAFNLIYNDIIEARVVFKGLPDSNPSKLPFNDKIELKNVSFSYEDKKSIIENLSLSIPKDQRVGFIGPSGSGKTTIIDLIIGLLTPDSGSICVDGKNIANHIREWQANIGYIPQHIFIFNDSIKANIALGIAPEKIDKERICKVIEMAQLSDFVSQQPQGVDTIVGDHGIKLSGGEQQRLGIARALYRDPEILVMDEATSALDNTTENEFMSAIDSLTGQKTIIIIAHRLTTVENCDKVIDLQQDIY